MQWPRGLLVALALVAAGCADRNAGELSGPGRPIDAEQLARVGEVARAYLHADGERLCALRTERDVRRRGGPAPCARRLSALAKASMIDLGSARILPADTTGTGTRARVVIDFGKAVVESGQAVGGQVLEMDLRVERGDYRVTRVGVATFAD